MIEISVDFQEQILQGILSELFVFWFYLQGVNWVLFCKDIFIVEEKKLVVCNVLCYFFKQWYVILVLEFVVELWDYGCIYMYCFCLDYEMYVWLIKDYFVCLQQVVLIMFMI